MELKINIPITEDDLNATIDYLEDQEAYYNVTPSWVMIGILAHHFDVDREQARQLIECISEESKQEVIKQFYDYYTNFITERLKENLSIKD